MYGCPLDRLCVLGDFFWLAGAGAGMGWRSRGFPCVGNPVRVAKADEDAGSVQGTEGTLPGQLKLRRAQAKVSWGALCVGWRV